MGNGIECLAEIYCHDGGAGWGFPLVETSGDGLGDGEEGGGGGSLGSETVLGVSEGEAVLKVREDKPLQHLDCGGEEGDWAVGGSLGVGFTGFWYGYDDGLAPYGWEVGIHYGEVEKVCQVEEACGSKVAEVVDVQVIGSEGGGGAGVLDGAEDELRGEGFEVVVQGPFPY